MTKKQKIIKTQRILKGKAARAIFVLSVVVIIIGILMSIQIKSIQPLMEATGKQNQVTALSEQLLLSVKMKEPIEEFTSRLGSMDLVKVVESLDSDANKKAFWINIYNAYYQILRLQQKVDKSNIYGSKAILIGGHWFSLDDIEHGILRKYRYKFSLGYLPNPFVEKIIKRLAVSQIDYRIHFALNCGATSCPPIAFYSADRIEQQLEMSMLSFLEQETKVLPEKNEIHITRLFQWFLGDFGGKKGIRNILKEKLNIDTKGAKLVYRDYDWTDDLHNFKETIQ